MVEQHDDRRSVVGHGIQPGHGFDGRMARGKVVDATGRVHLAVASEPGRRGEVVRHDIPRHNGVALDVELVGQKLAEPRGVRLAQPPHRGHVLLAVELQSVVRVAVEVDRQLRDAQQRPITAPQHRRRTRIGLVPEREVSRRIGERTSRACGGIGECFRSLARNRDTARQAQVAVEPGVQQHAAVDLHAELAVAQRAAVGLGSDSQIGAVGVGADHAEAQPLRIDPGAGAHSNNAAAVAHHEALRNVEFAPRVAAAGPDKARRR